MMNVFGWLAGVCTAAARPARRLYRYLTGDATCLGFVRAMAVIVVTIDVVSLIAYVRAGNLYDAGWTLAGSASLLIFLGPRFFREAADTDRSPIGPGLIARARPTDFYVAMSLGMLIGIPWRLVAIHTANEVFTQLGAIPFFLAMWGPADRDGGKGERTLMKDLRRLLGRSGPELAGGQALRPATIDT